MKYHLKPCLEHPVASTLFDLHAKRPKLVRGIGMGLAGGAVLTLPPTVLSGGLGALVGILAVSGGVLAAGASIVAAGPSVRGVSDGDGDGDGDGGEDSLPDDSWDADFEVSDALIEDLCSVE